MKIDSSNRPNVSGTATNAAPAARGQKSATTSGGGSQDNVQLSPLSTQIQALETSIGQATGIDTGKVESIKQAVDSGRYAIDPETIADKLISSTRELLAQQKG